MGIEAIKVNRSRIIEVINTSLQARENRVGVFGEGKLAPENDYIDLLKNHGQRIDDPNFPLHALFYTTTMVRGDDTALLFKRITDENLLKNFDWIFKPKEILDRKEEEVIDACFQFFRPGGYNSDAFSQWVHNSLVLEYKFGGDLKNYFNLHHNNATEIIDALVVKPRAKTHNKPEFRRFGPKLSRLFIQWVNQYDLYNLDNHDKNGIPIDFQIGRLLIQTKGIELTEPTKANDVTTKTLLPLLTDIFASESFIPHIVSETLWTIGSRCCNKKRHDLCPLENMCTSLISRDFYDKGGVFDPQDVGRFKL
jgi:hypothetical protein